MLSPSLTTVDRRNITKSVVIIICMITTRTNGYYWRNNTVSLNPKQCVNASCSNVFYVPDYKLHMCLQCQACVDKSNKQYTIQVHQEG